MVDASMKSTATPNNKGCIAAEPTNTTSVEHRTPPLAAI